MSPEAWINIIAILFTAAVGGLGAMLFFILRSIQTNQQSIWTWAKEAVGRLETRQEARLNDQARELTDMQRWMRHETRSIYSELIELARHHGAQGVVHSLEERLRRDDI